jgi:hypothetical protein
MPKACTRRLLRPQDFAPKVLQNPKPRKALLGAFTILINLYQNCFATFSYAAGIASEGHCAAGIEPQA